MAMLVPGYAARVLVSTWPGTGPGTRPDTETDVHPSLGNFPSTRFATQRQCSVTLSDRSYHVIYRDLVSTVSCFYYRARNTIKIWMTKPQSEGWGGTRTVGQQAIKFCWELKLYLYLPEPVGLQCAASICNPLIYWLAPGCCWHGHHSGLRVCDGNQYSVITRM